MNFALSNTALNWIKKTLSPGKKILELGSGEGSARLAQDYIVYSVEHDSRWLSKYPTVHYIHAPLKQHKIVKGFDHDVWYSPEAIRKGIEGKKFDLIIVDGPPGKHGSGESGRSGFLKYLDIFPQNIPILFDDYHRTMERNLASKVAHRLNSDLLSFGYGDDKWMAICWPGKEWK